MIDSLNAFEPAPTFSTGRYLNQLDYSVTEYCNSDTEECKQPSVAITPPIRSPEFPCGLPWVSDSSRAKIILGDALLESGLEVMDVQYLAGGEGGKENPSGSYQWIHPKQDSFCRRDGMKSIM